ncbi:hypothetical protein BDQ17DRAFT_1279160 [Cyathus striatus]|nr:hypothetical protein BDQ17DRAFT_1279160 [Cyathus striatus]
MPAFNEQTTIQQIAAAYPGAIKDLTFLITGATAGLGLNFAKFVAQEGAGTVVITGRSEEKIANALEEVKSTASPSTTIKTIHLNLESEDSVRRAAKTITSGELGIPKIDVLLNNAGIFAVPYKKVNGYESQFYCNHLSHFLFTNLIISHIKSPGGRIINVSSEGHQRSPVHFDDVNFNDGKDYDEYVAYGQSKTANILFTKSLNKRLSKTKGIQSFAAHPGLVVTGIMSHLDFVAEGIKDPVSGIFWDHVYPVTVDQGTATYLYGALAPELNGKGGAYLKESQVADTAVPMTEEDMEKLWDLSNNVFGAQF